MFGVESKFSVERGIAFVSFRVEFSLSLFELASPVSCDNREQLFDVIVAQRRNFLLFLQSNKPIMEKRRRARINNSLNDLQKLMLDAKIKDVSVSISFSSVSHTPRISLFFLFHIKHDFLIRVNFTLYL